MLKNLLIILLFLVLGFSCIPHRNLVYLRKSNASNHETYKSDSIQAYTIQPGDILDIQVSTPGYGQVEVFTKEFTQSTTGQASPASMYIKGYFVSDSGIVTLPIIGKVKAVGYTTDVLSDTLKKKFSQYLEFVTVTSKLLNYRVSVLGEVKNPGTQYVYNGTINIFQALGMAGDVTDLANRKNIKIIRKTGDLSEVITLDISDRDIIKSKYFYLLPNDVIYVEPLKVKVLRVNSATISITVSIITLLIVVTNFINRNS